MDGFINLDKPVGISSAKALYRVRRICGVRKSGHTGTLDPMASGVLVICTGRATRMVERVMDQPKIYRATVRLDLTSPSYDAEKETTAVQVPSPPTIERVQEAVDSFVGEIDQRPPAFSALKVRGVPAYKLARREQPVELPARRVNIYWSVVHQYEWPVLDLEVACGRGTYIRSLVRDIGEHLDTGGCLMTLSRRAVGPFASSNSWTFERMETASPDGYILPLDAMKAVLEATPVAIPPRPPVA